jgi:hypothetical protein
MKKDILAVSLHKRGVYESPLEEIFSGKAVNRCLPLTYMK